MKYIQLDTVEHIIAEVETYYKFPHGVIRERGRTKTVAKARRLAMYLSRQYTGLSNSEIADVFHRDASTVLKVATPTGIEKEIKIFNKKFSGGFFIRLLKLFGVHHGR